MSEVTWKASRRKICSHDKWGCTEQGTGGKNRSRGIHHDQWSASHENIHIVTIFSRICLFPYTWLTSPGLNTVQKEEMVSQDQNCLHQHIIHNKSLNIQKWIGNKTSVGAFSGMLGILHLLLNFSATQRGRGCISVLLIKKDQQSLLSSADNSLICSNLHRGRGIHEVRSVFTPKHMCCLCC